MKKLRWLFIGLLVVMIVLTLPMINTLRGEGRTFSSSLGQVETKRFFGYIEDEAFDKAAGVIDLSGHEKTQFVNDMETLFSQSDLKLVSYDDIKFQTDDYYTTGTVELEFEESNLTFGFQLMLSRQDGKLCPMSITQVSTSIDSADRADELSQTLDSIWSTHEPN